MKGTQPQYLLPILIALMFAVAILGLLGVRAVKAGSTIVKDASDVFCPEGFDTCDFEIPINIQFLQEARLECRLAAEDGKTINDLSCGNSADYKTCFAIKDDGILRAYASNTCDRKVLDSLPRDGRQIDNSHGRQIYCDSGDLGNCLTAHEDGTVVRFTKATGGDDVKFELGASRPVNSIDCEPGSGYCYIGGTGEVFRVDKSSGEVLRKVISVHPQDSRFHMGIRCDSTYCYVMTMATETLDHEIYMTKFAKNKFGLPGDIQPDANERVSDADHSSLSCFWTRPNKVMRANDLYCESNEGSATFNRCYIPATKNCIGVVGSNDVDSVLMGINTNSLEVFGVYYYLYTQYSFGTPIFENFGVDCDEEYCYVAHRSGVVVKINKVLTAQPPHEIKTAYGGVDTTSIDCIGDPEEGTCYAGFRDGTFGWFRKETI